MSEEADYVNLRIDRVHETRVDKSWDVPSSSLWGAYSFTVDDFRFITVDADTSLLLGLSYSDLSGYGEEDRYNDMSSVFILNPQNLKLQVEFERERQANYPDESQEGAYLPGDSQETSYDIRDVDGNGSSELILLRTSQGRCDDYDDSGEEIPCEPSSKQLICPNTGSGWECPSWKDAVTTD